MSIFDENLINLSIFCLLKNTTFCGHLQLKINFFGFFPKIIFFNQKRCGRNSTVIEYTFELSQNLAISLTPVRFVNCSPVVFVDKLIFPKTTKNDIFNPKPAKNGHFLVAGFHHPHFYVFDPFDDLILQKIDVKGDKRVFDVFFSGKRPTPQLLFSPSENRMALCVSDTSLFLLEKTLKTANSDLFRLKSIKKNKNRFFRSKTLKTAISISSVFHSLGCTSMGLITLSGANQCKISLVVTASEDSEIRLFSVKNGNLGPFLAELGGHGRLFQNVFSRNPLKSLSLLSFLNGFSAFFHLFFLFFCISGLFTIFHFLNYFYFFPFFYSKKHAKIFHFRWRRKIDFGRVLNGIRLRIRYSFDDVHSFGFSKKTEKIFGKKFYFGKN